MINKAQAYLEKRSVLLKFSIVKCSKAPAQHTRNIQLLLRGETSGETRRAHPSSLLNAVTKSEPKGKLFSSWDHGCSSSLKCTVKGCRETTALPGKGLSFRKDALPQAMTQEAALQLPKQRTSLFHKFSTSGSPTLPFFSHLVSVQPSRNSWLQQRFTAQRLSYWLIFFFFLILSVSSISQFYPPQTKF